MAIFLINFTHTAWKKLQKSSFAITINIGNGSQMHGVTFSPAFTDFFEKFTV